MDVSDSDVSKEDGQSQEVLGEIPEPDINKPLDPFNERKKARVLLIGLRNAGKHSIQMVVFEGLPANETLFLQKDLGEEPDERNRFISLQLWNIPGNRMSTFEEADSWTVSFENVQGVIFVIDGQDIQEETENKATIIKLAAAISKAYLTNPNVEFEVFIHKKDGMSDDYRMDTVQMLRDRLSEDLYDISPELESRVHPSFHLTSIYDASIYEALSKLLCKLMPEQAALERLLDALCQQCSMEKAYLFDMTCHLYIATDSATADASTFELLCGYLDMVEDLVDLYEGDADSGKDLDLDISYTQLDSSLCIAQFGMVSQFYLVVLMPSAVFQENTAMVSHNVAVFRKALIQTFMLHQGV